MSWTGWYLLAQFTVLALAAFVAAQVHWAADPRSAVWSCRWALGLALLAPLGLEWLPTEAFWQPAAQIWSAPTPAGGTTVVAPALPDISFTISSTTAAQMGWAVRLGLVGAAAWAVLSIAQLLWRLRRLKAFRRIGRVELTVGDERSGAFAAWWPGRAIVALDPASLLDGADRRLAVRHELQHHRHRDPVFAWIWVIARAAFWWNPGMHFAARSVAHLEEMAVDAALVDRGVDVHAYGTCLLRAAGRGRPQLTLGLPDHRRLLKRRLIRMTGSTRRRTPLLGITLAALLVTATAWAADALHHHRLDPELSKPAYVALEAQGWSVDTPAVHTALEALVERRSGRAFARRALKASPDFVPYFEASFATRGLPAFLLAVPFVESGFRNLPQSAAGPSAGFWQFIAPTARAYDLVVEGGVDERLDPTKSADAAARLLTDLHGEFGDWGLALAAYNQGAEAVRAAIKSGGTRDVFALIQGGHLNQYAARVAAAALLLQAPEWVGADPADARVTLTVKDAQLGAVLKQLAEMGDRDLQIEGTIDAKVSISVRDTQWRTTLDLLLERNGLKAVDRRGALVITRK